MLRTNYSQNSTMPMRIQRGLTKCQSHEIAIKASNEALLSTGTERTLEPIMDVSNVEHCPLFSHSLPIVVDYFVLSKCLAI